MSMMGAACARASRNMQIETLAPPSHCGTCSSALLLTIVTFRPPRWRSASGAGARYDGGFSGSQLEGRGSHQSMCCDSVSSVPCHQRVPHASQAKASALW